MLPPELVKKIRLLEIRTSRAVDELTGGSYRSVFKGRGIEFDEVRPYTPGDDVRDIDWNVTARMGSPYLKKFVEERELTVLFLVDVSASGNFGSAARKKRETAAELAALLAFSAGRAGDKTGLLMFSDRTELYLPPRSGRSHTLRMIREMLAFEPQHAGTDLDLVLRETARLLRKRSIIFLLSDLVSEPSFERSLKILNRRHDVVALEIFDPLEHRWPLPFAVEVEDAESGERVLFGGGRKNLERVNASLERERAEKRALCRRAKVDLVEIEAGGDVLRPVIDFFSKRRKHPAGGPVR